jgi:DNA-directed RNA polymerase specialized sigma24 family protein
LEEDDRRVILLRYDAQLSFAEIGVELGMSKNGVFARHNRALERLRDMFAIRRL